VCLDYKPNITINGKKQKQMPYAAKQHLEPSLPTASGKRFYQPETICRTRIKGHAKHLLMETSHMMKILEKMLINQYSFSSRRLCKYISPMIRGMAKNSVIFT
jgi:hypothetical protein